jgi:hypothetical protein
MDAVVFDDGTTVVNRTVLLRDRATLEALALGAEGIPVDSMRIAEV